MGTKKFRLKHVGAVTVFHLRRLAGMTVTAKARQVDRRHVAPSKHDDPAYQGAFLRDLFENHPHSRDADNS